MREGGREGGREEGGREGRRECIYHIQLEKEYKTLSHKRVCDKFEQHSRQGSSDNEGVSAIISANISDITGI